MLAKYGLKCWAISNHLVGQLVLDLNDARTDDWVPAQVRGDAQKKTDWAIQEMKDTARAAQKLGVPPAEMIFLDDNERPVAAARALGINAILFQDTAQAIAAIEACLQAHAT